MTDQGISPPTNPERAALERQAHGLEAATTDDEGTVEWRSAMRESVDQRRASRQLPPLEEWWAEKSEPELHERARALGLLS